MPEINEMRVIGPPGCGKTTRLTRYVEESVDRYGAENVLVTSLTKAAAREVAGRNSLLEDDRIGTLHAHAFRSLGRPDMAEDRKALQHWNDVHKGSPHLQLTVEGLDTEDAPAEQRVASRAAADDLFAEYKTLRSQMRPRDMWPPAVMNFALRWEEFKANEGLRDFNDLMDDAMGILAAPGNPRVILVDEAQDHDRQQFRLLRHWAEQVDALIVVGDPDQNLYEWRGSEPEAWHIACPLHELVPADSAPSSTSLTCTCKKTITLEQSYRVPRAVHATAVDWIGRTPGRVPVVYRPTGEEGEVLEDGPHFMENPWRLIEHVEHDLSDGKTVMFLASCSYMVDPLVKELRRQGLPFWNPWRTKNGRWNPMRRGTRKQTTGLDRVLAYYGPELDGDIGRMYWTGRELKLWASVTRGLLARGAKDAISELHDDHLVQGDEFSALFKDVDAEQVSWDLDRLPEHIQAAYQRGFEYPWRIAKERGPQTLAKEPQITVGTVHCSPSDEPVLTTSGWVPIGDLDPSAHRLMSYIASTNQLLRGKNSPGMTGNGYPFARAEQFYSGELVEMRTAQSRARVTPNHRVRARFADEFSNKWLVYLMRRGVWYRVGICTSGSRPYKSGGLGGRLATEQAEAGWILGVYESRNEALIAEAVVQGRYGIPSTTFEAATGRALSRSDLHRVHAETNTAVLPRVEALMRDYGLLAEWPLYSRNGRVRNGYSFETVAANLLSGWMEVPVARPEDFGTKAKPGWLPVSAAREDYSGTVHSLHVKPHRHYISGGQVVHNSVKGAEADVVYLAPDLSMAGSWEWQSSRGEAALRRLFYVGMTRAREKLVLCNGKGVRWWA